MSTHAAIGIVQADGTIKAIYLHNDGYPSFAGAILAGWYNTVEKAEALIALGALRRIGEKIEPAPNKPHTFENWQEDVVLPITGIAAMNYAPATFTKTKSIISKLQEKTSGQITFTFSAMVNGFFTVSKFVMNGSGLKQ